MDQEEQEGRQHLDFAILIAKIQLRAGRGFLFEHPCYAACWKTPQLQRLREEPGVYSVDVDLCRFGLKTSKGHPALKPTLLLTNIEPLASVLQRRCQGHHTTHQPLLSGEAGLAAKYTPAFVDAILRGLRQHVQRWIKANSPNQDYWEQKAQTLTRHHRVPRRALFVPMGANLDSHRLNTLSSQRTTYLHYKPDHVEVLNDDWREAPRPRRAMDRLWTGSTTFAVEGANPLPDDWQHVANYIAIAAAHPTHQYLTDETDLQVAWNLSFPTHKILGGTPSTSGGDPGDLRDLEDDLEDIIEGPENRKQPIKEEETSDDRLRRVFRPMEVEQRRQDGLLRPSEESYRGGEPGSRTGATHFCADETRP